MFKTKGTSAPRGGLDSLCETIFQLAPQVILFFSMYFIFLCYECYFYWSACKIALLWQLPQYVAGHSRVFLKLLREASVAGREVQYSSSSILLFSLLWAKQLNCSFLNPRVFQGKALPGLDEAHSEALAQKENDELDAADPEATDGPTLLPYLPHLPPLRISVSCVCVHYKVMY